MSRRKKNGYCRNSDGYLRATTKKHRNKYLHRLWFEVILGRPLRPDEEVEHLCRNRGCWPPTDFHLCLMPASLHDAVSATNGNKASRNKAPKRPRHA